MEQEFTPTDKPNQSTQLPKTYLLKPLFCTKSLRNLYEIFTAFPDNFLFQMQKMPYSIDSSINEARDG